MNLENCSIAILPIVTGQDTPVLRTKTKLVAEVNKKILKLIKDMEQTMVAADGVGLAAPQIDLSIRLCIAKINGKTVPLINPQIFWRSEETDVLEEGCLSLPGVNVKVERPVKIRLRYLNEKGNEKELELEGFNARVTQHEVDHLEGVLIVDHEKDQIAKNREEIISF